MGLLDQKIAVTPTCRYGHGEMQSIQSGLSGPLQFMAPIAGNLVGLVTDGIAHISPTYYSFLIYKCQQCSYLEMHDYAQGATNAAN